MPSLPANVYSVDTVRAIDQAMIASGEASGYELMTRAAKAAVSLARHWQPGARRWQVICGAGNNGGDGYVFAGILARLGHRVSVVSMSDPESLSGDAAEAYRDCRAAECEVSAWNGKLDSKAQILIDAILGSGLQRDLEGDIADVVAAINAHSGGVLALDVPTGLNADSGAVMGSAVIADCTMTFVGLKAGLFINAGPEHCGDVSFAGLDIPAAHYAAHKPVFARISDTLLHAALPPRPLSTHKGDNGHLLVVGGGPGMPGAARLCAEAALRTGAGRVTVATHPDHAAWLPMSCPELMTVALDPASNALSAALEQADVVAFGPGLGQSDWSEAVFAAVAAATMPAVWDADALNYLAKVPNVVENRVITPHPGEAATLLNTDIPSIQSDRPAAAVKLQARYGGVAVLKGAGSLIDAGRGTQSLCTWGNPGMAAPGMGDVLTGCIAGLLAQGLPLSLAARVGVGVHARAGDLAAVDGERGLRASDVIDALRDVVNPCERILK